MAAARIASPPTLACIAPLADAQMRAVLTRGQALVERATAPGLAFSLEDLGSLDLPEPDAARVDRAQLRALASIYLAADLEPAGIIAGVQQLASLSSTGGLPVDLRGAEPLVARWWKQRNDRMSQDERGAFFARLFGTSAGPGSAEGRANQRFEARMLDLCEALSAAEEPPGGADQGSTIAQRRVRLAARALAQNLGDSSSGMVAFVAREVIATLQEAFAILGHPDLRGAFRATDIWAVLAAIARLGHVRFPDPRPYIRRGKAGMVLLSWLADSLPAVLGAGAMARPGQEVIGAAVDWLEATLALGEGAGAAPPAAALPGDPGSASVWSSLAQ